MLKHLPKAPGIYQIKCTINNKFYIGSAVNVYNRCDHHRRSLRYGNHKNIYLQAYDRNIGFNIFKYAGSPGDAFAQTWEGFVDPTGNEITIQNLFDFCRQNHLDFPSMLRLAKGKSKLKSYKGWTHKNSVRQRDYTKTYEGFIDPQGIHVGPIRNLSAFCRENNLHNTHMVAVAKGRLYSHRGWTYNNDRKNLGYKTYTGFISPNGTRIIITNLQVFCRENNLETVHMRELISGKRKSHKGWTWKAEDESLTRTKPHK